MLKHTSAALVFIAIVFLFQNCGNPKAMQPAQQTSTDDASGMFTAGTDISVYQEGYPLSENTALVVAQFLHLRLAGVRGSPTDETIKKMVAALRKGEKANAALIATNATNFIDLTVRDFASKMSTREGITTTPLNDFIATVMGTVRDNKSAKLLLNGDQIYAFSNALSDSVVNSTMLTSNTHYTTNDGVNKTLSTGLVAVKQSVPSPTGTGRLDHPDAAGLLTTRNYMETHIFQGTNRRAVEYAFKVFLCTPIDAWASTTNPDSHIGRDIGREPVEEYNNKCKGCHTGMDALRPAAAYYDFKQTDPATKAGYVEYRKQYYTDAGHTQEDIASTTSGAVGTFVAPKYRRGNEIFPGGFIVKNNSWVNYADQNLFGWNGATSGTGMKDFGAMLANSEGFPKCMAKRVFKTVCGEDIDPANTGLVDKLAIQFKQSNYNLRTLFVQAVLRPECGSGI